MKSICLCFKAHQPVRLKKFRFFDIGNSAYYYDDFKNETITRRVAANCYLPANKIILDLINKYKGRFKVSFSISGTAIDQFKIYAPEVIESFRALADTGCVEFLAETYSHSLAAINNKDEFKKQVKWHARAMESLFGLQPSVFANTGFIYSDEIGAMVAEMGYKAILAEGPSHILQWKSPNYLYHNKTNPSLNILLKNDSLSDDIAFRFSDTKWCGWPLTAKEYVSWLNKIPKKEKIVNLFMDYETFGEHQKSETGIFDFLKSLPTTAFGKSNFKFMTPSGIVASNQPISTLDAPYPISGADQEKDLSAWLGNELQQDAFDNLYKLSDRISECSDQGLLKDWQYLQTSDHFYYMGTKCYSDGDIHAYFNPYESPYEAFINYMNVLNDFTIRLKQEEGKRNPFQLVQNKSEMFVETV